MLISRATLTPFNPPFTTLSNGLVGDNQTPRHPKHPNQLKSSLPISLGARPTQCPHQVSNQILGVFYPNREPDQVVGYRAALALDACPDCDLGPMFRILGRFSIFCGQQAQTSRNIYLATRRVSPPRTDVFQDLGFNCARQGSRHHPET